MKLRNIGKLLLLSGITSIFIIAVTSVIDAQTTKTTKDDIWNKFREDKKRIGRTDKEIKDTMKKIVDDLKKKNMKFKVELNEMMKYKISEITGTKPPSEDELKKKEEERRRKEELEKEKAEKRKRDELRRQEEERKKREEEINREKDRNEKYHFPPISPARCCSKDS